MPEELAKLLAESEQCYLIAPAGFGKTELIAQAVGMANNGKQLILTHTHAGVRSLKDRLKKRGTPQNNYDVDTIAGWALRISSAYPKTSDLKINQPVGNQWNEVYESAVNLLKNPVLGLVINHSYKGLYVDEYQDCILPQHKLILALSKMLPTKILGDPLQGIFDFGENQLVRWREDVDSQFRRLPSPSVAWRWKDKNPKLGAWLTEVRELLVRGAVVDFRQAPVTWMRKDVNQHRKACFNLVQGKGSVLAIHTMANTAHSFARQLRGTFQSMEEMESKDLLAWANSLEDQAQGIGRAAVALDGVVKCWIGVSTQLQNITKGLKVGKIVSSRKYISITELITSMQESNDLSLVLQLMEFATKVNGAILFRKELWIDMLETIRIYLKGGYASLVDTAWFIRNQARRRGRSVEYRTVSRNLLIKGLEFDHVIVLDADAFDAKNLYVALTRSTRTLTVFSDNPTIQCSPFSDLT